jgi:hypothetical protein
LAGTTLHFPVRAKLLLAFCLLQYTAQGKHRALVDFEEALEDITADWLNPSLLVGPA